MLLTVVMLAGIIAIYDMCCLPVANSCQCASLYAATIISFMIMSTEGASALVKISVIFHIATPSLDSGSRYQSQGGLGVVLSGVVLATVKDG